MVNYKFDQMRYKSKKEATETVAQLRAQYITEIGRKKKRLPQRATRLLNEWFEQHLDYPYPTEREKRLLSRRCDITVEQLSRWFANKINE
jgi:secreted Zn-dependent insulinase-like peptidase